MRLTTGFRPSFGLAPPSPFWAHEVFDCRCHQLVEASQDHLVAQRSVSRLAPNPAPANSLRAQATLSKPSPRCGAGSTHATLNGSRHSRLHSYDHHRLGLHRPALAPVLPPAPQGLARHQEIRGSQARPPLPLLDECLDPPWTGTLVDAQQCSCGRYRPSSSR